MDPDEKTVRVVEDLQTACAQAFRATAKQLAAGMTETDIEVIYQRELSGLGYPEHWYDVLTVLIGRERFEEGTLTADYKIKGPSGTVKLNEGDCLFIDASPVDPDTRIWGDWASTVVFHPQTSAQHEQVRLLEEMRQVLIDGISRISAGTTGADIAQYYLDQYAKRGMAVLDVRQNVGHSMHSGAKAEAKRVWLDLQNQKPLGSGVFAVEPGGVRRADGAVARFEECIYIPETGPAQMISSGEPVMLMI